MQKVTFKLRAVLWFLKRPRLYPELFRRVVPRLLGRSRSPDTRQEAECWCEERAMSTSEAVAKITGSPMCGTVREKFKDVFVTAEEVYRTCPIGGEIGGAANLDLLYWLAEYLEAENVIETGVAYGWSSLAILLSLTKRSNVLLVSTDMPYVNRNYDKYVGCVVPAEFKSHWRIINRADRDALPKALKEFQIIDMCHYDSDKSYAGRMWAYPRLWKALKLGGCFISDDIGDNLAFRDFCSQVNVDPIIIRTLDAAGVKYVGILVKSNVG